MLFTKYKVLNLMGLKKTMRHCSSRAIHVSKLLSISIIAFISVATSVNAAQRVVVNEARIQVDDQSQRTQQRALKQALRQVFVKMSGSASVLDNAGVKAALVSPDKLLRAYRFAFENGVTYYVAEFDEAKLTGLLQREMLPVWGDRRPETIVWIAQQNDDASKIILDESQSSLLKESLTQTAKERGVPLSLPLMDLTDSVNITTYDIWGRFVEPLKVASVRYGIDNIIGARVYRNDSEHIPDIPENPVEIDAQDNTEMSQAVEQNVVEKLGFEETAPMETGLEASGLETTGLETTGPETTEHEERELEGVDLTLADDLVASELEPPELSGEETNEQAPEATPTMPFTMDEFTEYAKRAKEGDYALDWVFIGGSEVSQGSIYGESPEVLAKQLVDAYSNYLSSLYAVVGIEESERQVMTISVANIGSIASYASVKAYLNSLSVIEDATLTAQAGTVATFSLTLVGTVDDLLNSLKLETKLRLVTDATGEAVDGYNFYWSN